MRKVFFFFLWCWLQEAQAQPKDTTIVCAAIHRIDSLLQAKNPAVYLMAINGSSALHGFYHATIYSDSGRQLVKIVLDDAPATTIYCYKNSLLKIIVGHESYYYLEPYYYGPDKKWACRETKQLADDRSIAQTVLLLAAPG